MAASELYTKGARLWIPDPETVWKGAEVVKDIGDGILTVEFEDGQQLTLTIKKPEDLPPLRNPDILIGENDLTSLSYLNEPEVLYNLKVRFCNHNAIYTYCGIVLVAINPYEDLPIYSNDTITAYRGQAMGDLDPHIFAVAEEAYTKMEREDQNQSIIVSGESGAGKTVSAKYAMRYFATVGGSTTETQVEKKVLASNPIMEAIGNAKTTRNDNSSRFGKYIEIDFNKHYHIVGANMRTYLLEKSRVVFQANDERNYHIFYQLCASSNQAELADLRLSRADDFHYTNQGASPVIAGVDDEHNFEETRNAFALLGFSNKDQMIFFRILAAILHLGNVELLVRADGKNDEESCAIAADDPHLVVATSLLGIDRPQLATWLCNRKIVSMKEVFTKPMNVAEAVFARDALAKHIYAQLFSRIVLHINKALALSSKVHKFIGVLDIYGFETFEMNSFEQFCINYANEKLQQQFNQHVFKLEQEEYVREKIEWKFIDFYDNQPCIDLIESKMGILDLLDEECKMPKGTDDTWIQKLYGKCSASKHFEKPRFSNAAFVVHHFADQVQYECAGFLVKNRDTVTEEHINILKASQYELVADMFRDDDDKKPSSRPVPAARTSIVSQKSMSGGASAAAGGQSQKQHKKTVGSQFRDSLNLLMSTLNSTNPHYIRCIKPNDDKMAFLLEPKRAVQQLRACGVLETIRISSAGFPSRWTYLEFLNRYRVLISRSKDINRHNVQATCEKILAHLIKDEDKFQFGKTKIFFRAGQVAYLEKLRSDRLRACGILIQKHVRGWLQRRRYRKIHATACALQRYARGLLARRHANFLRRTKAAIAIQKNVRMFVQRRKYLQMRRSALHIQSRARGIWARQRFEQMRRAHAAVVIQKWVRRWLAVKRYERSRKSIVLLQCCVRRMRARRELKKLKIEARSVEHVKKLNIGLENKIISLQQKIGELIKENSSLKVIETNNKELQSKLSKMKDVEATVKGSLNRVQELENAIQALRTELDAERGEKMDLVSEKELLMKNNLEMENRLNAENARLKEDIDRVNEQIEINEKNTEEQMKSKLENERTLLLQEFNDERTSYQKLLKDHARLEQRYENLQTEMSLARDSQERLAKGTAGGGGGGLTIEGHHTRTPSNLSTISLQSDVTEPASDSLATSFVQDEVQKKDMGYGSVRSRKVAPPPPPPIPSDDNEWTSDKKQLSARHVDDGDVVELSLMLKLQHKVKELENERARLEKRLEAKSGSDTPPDDADRMRDLMKLQELEMENAKLKDNLNNLRRATTEPGAEGKEILRQFHALQDELERRRDECIQLRTVLANKSQDMKHVAQESYSGDVDIINEDGELLTAFASQKTLIRQLEAELQDEKRRCKAIEDEFRPEMKRLKEDNDRQQKLISQNLQKTPQAQTEAIMQHEITRLTGENLDLTEKNDALTEQTKKLKRQLKVMAKRLKEAGGAEPSAANAAAAATTANSDVLEMNSDMPIVKHKAVEYLGMFEYKREDELALVKNLIYDLRPKVAMTLLPGLPAYIIFMCIRHSDYVNDDEKVRSLLKSTVIGIKRVIKKRHEDLEMVTLWLANTCRLMHNLKQYSGDKTFQPENTAKQNEQCLRNFDLSEYRQVLSDIAVWINQGVIKIMEEKVQPLIVPAVLEHEAIPGISGKPSGMRGRSSSVARELESPCVDARHALDVLQKELSSFYRVLYLQGVDPEIITQIFKQIFYFICAGALNNLLLRKDMCHWSKGMQIRYNLSHLEQWCRDQRLQDSGVTESLQPIIQASQLLQARKTDEDVNSIVEMCDKLSVVQITKILNLYTPADEFEERIPVSFIRKIQARLMDRPESNDPGQGTAHGSFLMDTKFAFPLRFPFNPSKIQLEDISIPDALNLPMLKKV